MGTEQAKAALIACEGVVKAAVKKLVTDEREAKSAKDKAPKSGSARQWGESRPGEMYIQVEGPGNPSWEQRNPQANPDLLGEYKPPSAAVSNSEVFPSAPLSPIAEAPLEPGMVMKR